MYKVSIICMIYKSIEFAEWVYQSIHKYTPMIEQGDAFLSQMIRQKKLWTI